MAIFLKLAILIHPETALTVSGSQVVWLKVAGFLEMLLGRSPFLVTFFALVNLFGQAIFLNQVANRHHLFPKSTYLPALTYILLTSLVREWNYLSAALVSNWLLLAMLSAMLQLYSAADVRKKIFNIGCYISLAAMLIFPHIGFVLLLLLALGILRPFKAAEWMVGLLGIITPFYFLAGILYLTGDLGLMRHLISAGFSLPERPAQPEPVLAALSLVVLLTGAGFFYLNGFMSRMLFQNKKWWWVVIAGLPIGILAGMFTVAKGYNQWMAALVPAAFVMANIWFEERRKWISTVFFYLFAAVVIFVQWYPAAAERLPAAQEKNLPQPVNGRHIKLNTQYIIQIV